MCNCVKHILTNHLHRFKFFYKLANIYSIFLNSLTVCFHYLLTNITFWLPFWNILITSWSIIFINVRESSRHLLHFSVNWLLSINLWYKTIHTLRKTLGYLKRHVWNDINDLFLSLWCFKISFYDIKMVEIFYFLRLDHHVFLDPKLRLIWFPLLCRIDCILHFYLKMRTLIKSFVPTEGIHWKFWRVSILMFIHLITHSFT